MQQQTSQRKSRRVLGIGDGTVVGFDPSTRSWVMAGQSAPEMIAIPKLDGQLVVDEATVRAASDDFGHIPVDQPLLPLAVLQPGSYQDIMRVVRFANRNRMKIAPRGQAHSTHGQPLVAGGIVVDMNSLATIHSIEEGLALVDAGVLWSSLLNATLAQGMTPPVFTDYPDTTVGGTLATGGIGGMSACHGAQIDNVLELTVVTGEGKLVECSPERNDDLFEAVLGGLGQYGIVVRAKLKLVPAPQLVRVYTAYYHDLATFTQDQIRCVELGFDYVEGEAEARPEGGWKYKLDVAKYYYANELPLSDDHSFSLLAALAYDAGTATYEDKSYLAFVRRLDDKVTFLKSIGAWNVPHPWFDVFVPGSVVAEYVGRILADLTVADTGNGPVLLYPLRTDRLTRPRLRLPQEPVVFLFDILRFAVPPTPDVVNSMMAQNRQFYDEVVALGGTRYPIGAIPNFTREDWQRHYGGEWDEVVADKRRFDRQNILTPGQGIFP